MQAVGIISAVGEGVNSVKVGTAAAVMTFGSYAEFMIVCIFLNYDIFTCFTLSLLGIKLLLI